MNAAVHTGLAAIDADGHVMEPPDMWVERLPRDLEYIAPQRTFDSQGRHCMQIGEHVWVAPQRNPDWPVRTTGGRDPKVRLEDMDLEGIEIAVLFPRPACSLEPSASERSPRPCVTHTTTGWRSIAAPIPRDWHTSACSRRRTYATRSPRRSAVPAISSPWR